MHLQGMQHHQVAAPKSLYQTELRGARRSGKCLVTWQLQFITFMLKTVFPFAKNPSKKKNQPGSLASVTIVGREVAGGTSEPFKEWIVWGIHMGKSKWKLLRAWGHTGPYWFCLWGSRGSALSGQCIISINLWYFKHQHNLVEGISAHSRRVGTRLYLRIFPAQTILWFYHCMITSTSGRYNCSNQACNKCGSLLGNRDNSLGEFIIFTCPVFSVQIFCQTKHQAIWWYSLRMCGLLCQLKSQNY